MATREFGTTLLAFRPSLKGEAIRVMLLHPGPNRNTRHIDAKLNGASVSALRFSADDRVRQALWIMIDRTQAETIASSESLRIQAGDADVALSLPKFASVLQALDKCGQALRATWNADDAGKARIAKRQTLAVPAASIIRPADYPDQASSERKGGKLFMSLLVDEKGTVRDCFVDIASGNASLDTQSCHVIMRRARYHPARDSAGNPVRTTQPYVITWSVTD